MFQPVPSKVSFPEMEERILRFWRERDIFRKSVEQRPEDKLFVFYEGPPTANAAPGIHHVLARVFKDAIPRYRTMRGYRVPRKGGWDTHGLPVELEIERELGLKSKSDIESFGVEEFNRRCRESVRRYVREWEELTERIGFWVDTSDAYWTFDNDYIETGWWIVKRLWDAGLVYQDYRSAPHCPRCGTTLSDAEVAQGYEENTVDPSVYVKFRLHIGGPDALRLADGVPTFVVAWTTTPWTLPGNTALAVAADEDYVLAQVEGPQGVERLVVARALLESVLPDGAETLATFAGRELVGLAYEPLYEPGDWGVPAMVFRGGHLEPVPEGENPDVQRRIIAAPFVSLEDGSGVVHVAPAFGGEDFEIGKAEGLLYYQPVDLRGLMTGASPFEGKFVKDADGPVMEDLAARGLLLRRETISHTYPFCWRCATPLLYYAKPCWYIRTTSVKERLVSGNETINWYPEHMKRGRFGDWLENNVDWALSRERYWGTPLPLWRCAACDRVDCVGSRAELRERAVDPAQVDALTDYHRPYVDAVVLKCQACGGEMRRVPEVMDGWFDSGAMPYAQWHYPFENQDLFARMFPADFICEAVDQTRGWFYTLHAEATLLWSVEAAPESIAYRNVISLGHILDEQGRKMSKSLGNVVQPLPVVEEHGADALRWYLYTSSPAGNPRRFSGDLVAEALRRFLLTLWNVYSFFVTYAIIDGYRPESGGRRNVESPLDRWLLSELHQLVERVTAHMEAYNPTDAGRAVQAFVEDLSNWYVRRSRRRFWKAEDDVDKRAAYDTLYECLVTLSRLLAPLTPFLAEEMHQNLVRAVDSEAPESVHLAEWPRADASLVDVELGEAMRLAMRAVSLGRAARAKAGIKVRQVLAQAVNWVPNETAAIHLRRVAGEVEAELNVRQVVVTTQPLSAGYGAVASEPGLEVALDTALTPDLADEGLARELVHRLQTMRRSAGFEISDRITTYYDGHEDVRRVMAAHGEYIRQETLSLALVEGAAPADAHAESHKLDGREVSLAVRRAAGDPP